MGMGNSLAPRVSFPREPNEGLTALRVSRAFRSKHRYKMPAFPNSQDRGLNLNFEVLGAEPTPSDTSHQVPISCPRGGHQCTGPCHLHWPLLPPRLQLLGIMYPGGGRREQPRCLRNSPWCRQLKKPQGSPTPIWAYLVCIFSQGTVVW